MSVAVIGIVAVLVVVVLWLLLWGLDVQVQKWIKEWRGY